MLGPLAGLLLLSRPATTREWVVAGACLAWSAWWLAQVGGLGAQVARAAAVLLSGSFLVLTLWRPSNAVGRALAATAGAGLALAVWMGRLGIGWTRLLSGISQELSVYQTALRADWAAAGAAPELADEAAGLMHASAQLFPGLLMIAGIAGIRLAWTWYHRVAVRPLGPAPAPFPAFGFNDQLVWGWIAAIGLALVPGSATARLVAANLLLVLVALYAARGLAVFRAQTGRISAPVVIVVALVAMFLLPFVVGGLTVLGLADTWLDFRRRHATPTTGGVNR